jgi:hypothetical protein
MPTLLGARSSVSPLPAGRPTRKAVGSAGQLGFPAAGNWIDSGGGSSQLGPFNLPYRFWLCAITNQIFNSAVAWTRYDIVIRLIVNGAYGADLNGQSLHQNADSETNAVWAGQSLEAKFYCEANTRYDLQVLTYNTPANQVWYYQSPGHQNMYAYTVGEGVY